MLNTPKKFPESPDKKIKAEQLKLIIERHNHLVDQVTLLEENFNKKQQQIENIKKDTAHDINTQKKNLEQLKKLIRDAEQLKKIMSTEFKQIIKKNLFNRLEKRIDSLNYENYIYRDELTKLIKKKHQIKKKLKKAIS